MRNNRILHLGDFSDWVQAGIQWLSVIELYIFWSNLVDKPPVWYRIRFPVCHKGVLSLSICPFATGPAGWAKESTLLLIEWLPASRPHPPVSAKPPDLQNLAKALRHVLKSLTQKQRYHFEPLLPVFCSKPLVLPSTHTESPLAVWYRSQDHFRQGITELCPQNEHTGTRNKNGSSLSDDGGKCVTGIK